MKAVAFAHVENRKKSTYGRYANPLQDVGIALTKFYPTAFFYTIPIRIRNQIIQWMNHLETFTMTGDIY